MCTLRYRLLLPLGLLLVAALGAFGWLDAVAMPLPRLLLPTAAFLCYAAAGLSATRTGTSNGTPIALIWAIAVLARLVLLPLPPELSDDIYRYLWDGHVLGQGINPYAHPPAHDALAAIRTPWHGEINHPDVPTIYPPLAQLLFAAVAVTGGGVLGAKALWLGFDLGCGLLLQRIATRTGRDPAPVLVWYLWSPLLIVETAWSAHFDPVGLFLLAALILLAGSRGRDPGWRRAGGLGALLAAATTVKLAPAAALPALIRRHGWTTAAAFAAVCAALYLPFAGAGPAALTEGLRTYARHWSANEGAFALIGALVGDPVQARIVAAALVLGVVAYVTWRGFSIERALLWIIGAGLLLSPTVHPWYVLWVLPMAALRDSRPFLLLGGLAFLGYWGLASYEATGVWPQPAWTRAAMWLPVWLMLLWTVVPRASDRYPAAKSATKGSDPH
ncbi:MAG: DUF2029 domain-containing protein [Gemmatimonadetes bacterium]|nr:DUF2029 domain-containing protein [Gemmatimonadota bacterium]MYG21206.1 DUF2029 domain-containing protein [Gemmatimonadota bacterium]MYJ40517.1 DUF2029 domain-containing protein [Gemmatimonadota bacterium]